VLSSHRNEILPTVIIEAFSVGCPVVATRCQYGPTEILQGGKLGVLVPPGHVEALTQGMLEVLLKTRSFNPASLRKAVETYQIESAAQLYSRLFRQLMERKY